MVKFWRRVDEVFRPQNTPFLWPTQMPIIVGAPRSGTTLLRLMLDAHSELAIPPETGFLTLSEKLTGSGDTLRKKFYRSAVVNYPKPITVLAGFRNSGGNFLGSVN